MRTLALEEMDPVAPQVNRVQEERSISLYVCKLNENIEKLTKFLANNNMAGPGRYCRSDVQRPYRKPSDMVYVKAAHINKIKGCR